MGRIASPETQLRQARSENKELRKSLTGSQAEAIRYRHRVTTLEQELAQWKERFDLLLKRTPESLT